ncbi:MAG: hypothetical protein ACK6DC_18450, partial [Planctomycetota bacterium]
MSTLEFRRRRNLKRKARRLLVEQLEQRLVMASDSLAPPCISGLSTLGTYRPPLVSSLIRAEGEGGGGGGGVILGPNNPPLGTTLVKQNLAENKDYVIQASDFGFSDPNNSPPHSFQSIIVQSIPTYFGFEGGVVKFNNTPIVVGQEITVADIQLNKLKFVPTPTIYDPTKPHRNYLNFLDVDHNGIIDNQDAQEVTDRINSSLGLPSIPPPEIPPSTDTSDRYYDPDGDNSLNPLDVLLIANWIDTAGAGRAKAPFSFKVKDSGGAPNNVSLQPNVLSFRLSPNYSPTLADTALSVTVLEDAGAPVGAVGALVSTLTGGVSDANTGSPKGIAIIGSLETNGTWYYTRDAGLAWQQVGAVSASSSLLLADDPNTRVYFAPVANYNGTSSAALTIRAWDQNRGVAGTKTSTTVHGGSAAFSSQTDV